MDRSNIQLNPKLNSQSACDLPQVVVRNVLDDQPNLQQVLARSLADECLQDELQTRDSDIRPASSKSASRTAFSDVPGHAGIRQRILGPVLASLLRLGRINRGMLVIAIAASGMLGVYYFAELKRQNDESRLIATLLGVFAIGEDRDAVVHNLREKNLRVIEAGISPRRDDPIETAMLEGSGCLDKAPQTTVSVVLRQDGYFLSTRRSIFYFVFDHQKKLIGKTHQIEVRSHLP